jgi:hypothetical protein
MSLFSCRPLPRRMPILMRGGGFLCAMARCWETGYPPRPHALADLEQNFCDLVSIILGVPSPSPTIRAGWMDCSIDAAISQPIRITALGSPEPASSG